MWDYPKLSDEDSCVFAIQKADKRLLDNILGNGLIIKPRHGITK